MQRPSFAQFLTGSGSGAARSSSSPIVERCFISSPGFLFWSSSSGCRLRMRSARWPSVPSAPESSFTGSFRGSTGCSSRSYPTDSGWRGHSPRKRGASISSWSPWSSPWAPGIGCCPASTAATGGRLLVTTGECPCGSPRSPARRSCCCSCTGFNCCPSTCLRNSA